MRDLRLWWRYTTQLNRIVLTVDILAIIIAFAWGSALIKDWWW